MNYTLVLLTLIVAVFTQDALNNILSVAIDNAISDGTYLSVYQKYTAQTDPFYVPISKGSCNRRLDAIDLKNSSSFTGALGRVYESGKLVLGFPQVLFTNDSLTYGQNPERGFFYDMGLVLVEALGQVLLKEIKLETKVYSSSASVGLLDSTVVALAAGTVDAVWNFVWLPERLLKVDFTCWYDGPTLFAVYAKGNFSYGDTQPLSLEDWTKNGGAGLKVAYLGGSVDQQVNNAYFPQAETLALDDDTALEKIDDGTVDVAIAQLSNFNAYLLAHPNTTITQQPNTKFSYGGGVGLMTSKISK
jgi:ABC-type amino acid transport substrate-binding protein